MSVINVKIGFVRGLEAEDPVTESFLTQLDNIQPPVGSVVPWNTCESGIEGCRYEEHQM